MVAPSFLGAWGGSSGVSIGGQVLGQPGTGPIYGTWTLGDGDDFTALDLVNAANPNGAYFTTRGVYAGGGNMRSPTSGVLAVNTYVDPYFTGVADIGRGVPVTYDGLGATPPHSIISGEGTGAIRLMSGRQSTAEKAALNSGSNIERTAMIASIGRIVYQAPCIIEARLRYTANGSGAAGWHPAFWDYTTQPNQGSNGNEYGFEGNSVKFTAYQDDHTTASGINQNAGTIALTNGQGHDGNWHTHTVVIQPGYWSFLIDGVEVNRIGPGINFTGTNASTAGYQPSKYALMDFFMLTNPAYSGTFQGETYDASAWGANTTGMTCDCEWWRAWYPTSTGRHFKPQIASSVMDQQFTAGQAFSVTLPSAAAIWGASPPSGENVIGVQVEVEEPGSSNTTGFDATTGLPTWASYNAGTRVLSGTIPANSGRTHFKVDPVQAGCTGQPYRFRFDVAPVFIGATTQNFSNGSNQPLDVYTLWDVGRVFQSGSNKKGLTVGTLPTGMSFNASTGVISGAPTTNGTTVVTLTATNGAGQTTSQNVSFVVATAAAGVPAPTVTGTLTASWDPAITANLTTSSGSVTAMAGADSTSVTLANAGTLSTCPTVTTRNGKQVLRHAAASLQYLQATSALGLQGNPCTIVVIFEHATTAATQAVFDVAAGNSGLTTNRHIILSTTSLGINYRKADNASTVSGANVGTVIPTGIQIAVARSLTGSAAAMLNVNGQGTVVTGTPVSNGPTALATVTLGDSRETNAQAARYLDGWVYRVLVYSTYLSDADVETIAVWANTNYGTVNGA